MSVRLKSLIAASSLAAATAVQAVPTQEWAGELIAFSSQWSAGSWSAAQVLGAPNTFAYGDISTAWAPAAMNGGEQFVTVGFATPTYASGALVRETYGNGFVRRIEALDSTGQYHLVWAGSDGSQPGTPVDFMANWAPTPFLVVGLRVVTDTNHNLGAWEEIDAIQLIGDTVPAIPEPGSVALMLAGLGLIGARRLRRAR